MVGAVIGALAAEPVYAILCTLVPDLAETLCRAVGGTALGLHVLFAVVGAFGFLAFAVRAGRPPGTEPTGQA